MKGDKKIIYLVGMGPGNFDMMTDQAIQAVEKSDVIVGYTVYVDLVKDHFPDKEFKTTPMRKEIERCRMCFELAEEGKTVSMICSGDSGVITAANSGAAVLGCPLNHDYCVISLSDLLTPWEIIEKRLKAAIDGDFAIAIYNPSSHKRHDYLKRACDIMLASGASPDRKCGYVENIGRNGTSCKVCTLSELEKEQVNMFTTVFVGNSHSEIINGKLVTKRGYDI